MSKQNVVGTGGYSIATLEKAIKEGCQIQTSRGGSCKPRKLHRESLVKFVRPESAYDEKSNTITNPRSLVPFREGPYSYFNAVKELMKHLPGSVSKMTAVLTQDGSKVKGWSNDGGKTFPEVASQWVAGEKIAAAAFEAYPDLRKSIKGAGKVPAEIFDANIKTLQRSATGVTPYALPLVYSGFCIDSRWANDGTWFYEEYRIVVNRTTPEKERWSVGKARLADKAPKSEPKAKSEPKPKAKAKSEPKAKPESKAEVVEAPVA